MTKAPEASETPELPELPSGDNRVREITVGDLATKIAQDAASNAPLLLLDVREKWERDLCTLPHSLHIPCAEILNRAEELSPDSEIIVFCHHGYRSFQTCCVLQHLGFDKVRNLKGGIEAWAQEIDTKMSRY